VALRGVLRSDVILQLLLLDAELAKLRDRFAVTDENEDIVPSIRKFKKRIGRLNDWWGASMLADVNGEQCRKYVKVRGNKGGVKYVRTIAADRPLPAPPGAEPGIGRG
jgi:hypothetical protein